MKKKNAVISYQTEHLAEIKTAVIYVRMKMMWYLYWESVSAADRVKGILGMHDLIKQFGLVRKQDSQSNWTE